MKNQIRHIADVAELPNIVIQILPYAMNDHPGSNGPLTILEFDDSPPIGYAEGWGSGRLIESPVGIRAYLACYDLIRAAALPRDASLNLIRRSEGQNEVD
jgi:uncharacterized protein DUF5753